jgi:histone-lysine N-methyltransferase SETD1
VKKGQARKAMFSSSPVQFRDESIAGRGVFARRRFGRGEVIVPYAPKQRHLEVDDPEANAAAATKLTLLSSDGYVIVPDTSVPGGWLTNHSCSPNAALYSSGEGRIQATRLILPGQEVTIFYGWVTENEPERDPCLCGSPGCRGFINFDVSDAEVRALDTSGAAADAAKSRFDAYAAFLRSIDQEQVLETIALTVANVRRRIRSGSRPRRP